MAAKTVGNSEHLFAVVEVPLAESRFDKFGEFVEFPVFNDGTSFGLVDDFFRRFGVDKFFQLGSICFVEIGNGIVLDVGNK